MLMRLIYEKNQHHDARAQALSRAPHRQFLALDALPLHEEAADESNATRSDRENVRSRDGDDVGLQHGWQLRWRRDVGDVGRAGGDNGSGVEARRQPDEFLSEGVGEDVLRDGYR